MLLHRLLHMPVHQAFPQDCPKSMGRGADYPVPTLYLGSVFGVLTQVIDQYSAGWYLAYLQAAGGADDAQQPQPAHVAAAAGQGAAAGNVWGTCRPEAAGGPEQVGPSPTTAQYIGYMTHVTVHVANDAGRMQEQ